MSTLPRLIEEENDLRRVPRHRLSPLSFQFSSSAYVSRYPVPKLGDNASEVDVRRSLLVKKEVLRRSKLIVAKHNF